MNTQHVPRSAPGITASAFTTALAQAANGVSVVTTSFEHTDAGLTVSSMCSVCADPALLLVCVNTDNEFCELALASKHFAVNILPADATELATVFAGLVEEYRDSRFSVGRWSTLSSGSPVLESALVSLDCELESSQVHGTHRVFFGRVIDVKTNEGEPLVYSNRQFGRVTPS